MAGSAGSAYPASIWMFGGQGSQYFGMARDLYATEPVFRRAVAACDDLAAPMLGASLVDIIYRERPDRFAPFDRLLHSNPAIVAVQYGVAELLKDRGCQPDLVLGYSLGRIGAEIVAGTRALADGLRLAIRLAELAEDRIGRGGMMAVLAPVEEFPETWIAAKNFPGHFVVTGPLAALARVEADLGARQVAFQRLPVRHAFHCPLMDPIEADFTRFASAQPRRPPAAPLVSPTTVWDAIRQPVDFVATVRDLEARGRYRYVDLGPSGTMATFVKYNLQQDSTSEIVSTVTPFDRAGQNIARLQERTVVRGAV